MDSDLLRQAIGLGAIPITMGVVEAIKKQLPKWPGIAWPILALVVAFVINVLVAVGLKTDIGLGMVYGAISGFLAMSAYDKVDKSFPLVPHG